MQLDGCRTCRHSPMMFLMSSSSRPSFGVAGMAGLSGVAGVFACTQAPGLLSMSLQPPVGVAMGRFSVAVATTVLAKAAGSCGVLSSASPGGAVTVSEPGVSWLRALGSGVAGDRGSVAMAAVLAAGRVVAALPGVGGHPTGEGFLTGSPALLLGLRSWSSISRSTVLSPLKSSSAAQHRHSCQPHSQGSKSHTAPPAGSLPTSAACLALNPPAFPPHFPPEKG